MDSHPGNSETYAAANAPVSENSPLRGKKILFLGSSVTAGSGACGESFVDFLVRCDGVDAARYAVSGTTLCMTDRQDLSYVSRIHTIGEKSADAFVCQLSTNDAAQEKPEGMLSDSFYMEDFDLHTTAGAIEYIIAYVRKKWNCPILFYTGTKFDSPHYAELVALLREIQIKWHIAVLDLWHSERMNAVRETDYRLYMRDPVHPTRAGYRYWWLPEFEQALKQLLS